MSVLTYRLPMVTNGDGDASATVRAAGAKLLGVGVEIGTLEAFDLAITDEPTGTELLSLAAVAADAPYQPAAAMADPTDGTPLAGAFAVPIVFGRIEVAVSNGGDTLQGEITLVIER